MRTAEIDVIYMSVAGMEESLHDPSRNRFDTGRGRADRALYLCRTRTDKTSIPELYSETGAYVIARHVKKAGRVLQR